jgi:alpha-L-arabinofuranosidase
MDQCRQASIEPVIVINVMAHKYSDGPTLEALREAAVEWVRYANVTRKYGVKYWQLGNEQEHHPKLMSLDEYKEIYNTFTTAMKAVDPSIRTGIAIINKREWAEALIRTFPKQVDFIGCHQYQWENWTVDTWLKQTAPIIPNALSIENVIRASPRPDAEIMVTETSPQGKWHDGSGKPDIMRALCFAEMLLHYATIENLAYTHYWATHCPWSKEKADDGIASALTLENGLKPNATVIGLINRSLGSHMVRTERVLGSLRVFASHAANDGTLVLYLINKSDKPVAGSIQLRGMSPQKIQGRLVYAGTDYGDLNPKTTEDMDATLAENTVTTTLPGISLTILTLR